jgi:fluoroquinolone transport system permease protein
MTRNRIAATIRRDVRLQVRQGFYYAAAFVAAISVFGVTRVPHVSGDLNWLVPPLITSNLLVGTFYFMGALVLLEKGEGSLQAQAVTPLRGWEYLTSKVVTLSSLSIVENVSIVAAFYGPRPGYGYVALTAGVALASALLVLAGFMAVVAYDSINDYLAPSVLYAGVASLPVFLSLVGWEHWLVLAHPLYAALLLMRAAITPVEWWQLLYAIIYSSLSIALLARLSARLLQHFVVAPVGDR